MIPESIAEHDPKLLLQLLSFPPENHGDGLDADVRKSYNWLVENKYISEVEKSVQRRSKQGEEETHVNRFIRVEFSAKELKAYLGEIIGDQ